MKNHLYRWWFLVLVLFLSNEIFPQISSIGGFEKELPSYWFKASEPTGSILTWATDQAHTLARSLKITKQVTTEAAQWESENMVDYWSPVHNKDVDIKIGAFIKAENINTNPANDDQRWWVSYTFYDSVDNLIGETLLPIDQTQTTYNWYADTNDIGQTILPIDSWRTIIKFVGGKDATGTVWADDFLHVGREGAWAGQNWNTTVDFPTGWIYWLPPVGGNDGQITKGFENTRLTEEQKFSGTYSLKFDMPLGREVGDGFVGTKRYLLEDENAAPGDVIRISVMVKGMNLYPDSAALYPSTWSVGFTYGFFKGNGNHQGFNNVTGYPIDMNFAFPNATEFGWKLYYIDVKIPDDPEALALEVRLHIYSMFCGTVYFDDLKVEKLDVAEMNMIGGFEQPLPSYWFKGKEPSGSTLTWATDQAHSLGRSLKITKEVTSESAEWESENMVDYWSPVHNKDVDIKIGAFIKAENINTNPANDDQRWWVSYTFYDSVDNLIGETLLPINQTQATYEWYADTNDIGQTILPIDSWRTIIKFVGGKDATGTVWADDFLHVGREGAWAGQNWNTSVDFPTGWIYWLPPIGGNDGQITKGFENTRVTNEQAFTGMYSIKFDMPLGREVGDGFVGTKRYLLNPAPTENMNTGDITTLQVDPGDTLRIITWIKAMNLLPDSAALYPSTWAVGYTYGFFKGNGNHEGFNNVTGYPIDTAFVFPSVTQFDWSPYYINIIVPQDPEAVALEVRLHVYSMFVGTVYFDDLKVFEYSVTDVAQEMPLPETYILENNFPNPFNPATTIKYSVPRESKVSLIVYDILGNKIRTLVDDVKNVGNYQVVWDGRNDSGIQTSSGIYFYALRSGDFNSIKKMIMLK